MHCFYIFNIAGGSNNKVSAVLNPLLICYSHLLNPILLYETYLLNPHPYKLAKYVPAPSSNRAIMQSNGSHIDMDSHTQGKH
jgi:hypothetical protein